MNQDIPRTPFSTRLSGSARETELRLRNFVIDNRKGSWNVFQGLSWNEPMPDSPEGD